MTSEGENGAIYDHPESTFEGLPPTLICTRSNSPNILLPRFTSILESPGAIPTSHSSEQLLLLASSEYLIGSSKVNAKSII